MCWVIPVVPFNGFCTVTLTADQLLSTLPFGVGRFCIFMFPCYTFYTLLLLLLGKLYIYYAGNKFIYTVRVFWELMGQVRGWVPLKAGFKPPVVSATDRAKAVFPLIPSFLFVYVGVCPFRSTFIVLCLYHVLSSSVFFNLLHWWVLSFVYVVSPA